MVEIRKPIAIGKFYPIKKSAIQSQVKKFLKEQEKKDIKAGLVPHAGYTFSGKLTGHLIGQILDKKTFIILGVNHSGLGKKISFSSLDFETPLGVVKNNIELGKELLKKLEIIGEAGIAEEPHDVEHSIEVLLPFLQLNQEQDFNIIPILLKDLSYEDCRKISHVISQFLNEDIFLLVSSDFTHFGEIYGFVPFEQDIKRKLYDLDCRVIDEILKLNSEKVYTLASETTICGVYGITILTETAKIMNWKGKKVGYYTSGDITGVYDRNAVVGYGSVAFLA